MCGICGLAFPDSRASDASSSVAAMCETLVHRGPDDHGVHAEPKAALGTRRLSIIDLEKGHQPLSNENGTIWVAHNGEVYNFPQLREELASRGHRFRTRTDTETLVHAYEEWGEAFVHRLRGMFAFALWDAGKERLILVRDRIGIKPLYYTLLKDRTLVFGSEMKALLAYPRVPRVLDPRALDLYLTLEYIPAPHSIFKNIFKLPAASLLEYHRGAVKVKTYWEVPHSEPELKEGKNHRLEDVKEELYERIKEAIRLRLISDVPLGAFLSGGIDSSCIVGMMRELGVSPLRTFSVGFEDSSYDELTHARRIAEKFQTEHQEFILHPKALDLTDRIIRHIDEPFGDFSVFPTYLVSKMARNHVKVILSGDGGDEVFGGYEHYQAQKLARFPVTLLGQRVLSPVVCALPPSPKKKGLWNKIQRFCQGLDYPAENRHLRWMMFLSARDKGALYTEDFQKMLDGGAVLPDVPPFRDVFEEAEAFDTVNRELCIDLRTYLADDILVKVDRMSMAVSLETRVPLLDHGLVEFVYSLPGTWKLKGLKTKWIFKKTMERLLPKENIYRSKEGFSIPIKHWLRTDLKDLMLETLSPKRIREDGIFRYEAVQRMIRAHLEARKNFSHQLWALLVYEIWKDRYL
ncbi:MAG: asparagine synthase (glutamine-hydrolyzing) [Candidatus Aminicenantales bacterium]